MTQADENNFRDCKTCWFCENIFLNNKVRDHCHLTDKYKGAAHDICNINVKQKKVVLLHSHFTVLVILIVIFSPRNINW